MVVLTSIANNFIVMFLSSCNTQRNEESRSHIEIIINTALQRQ